MRGLTLIDLLIVLVVLALLLFAASRDFRRYDSQTLTPLPTPTPQVSN
jgi:Tfp pilus assembly protein PilE